MIVGGDGGDNGDDGGDGDGDGDVMVIVRVMLSSKNWWGSKAEDVGDGSTRQLESNSRCCYCCCCCRNPQIQSGEESSSKAVLRLCLI